MNDIIEDYEEARMFATDLTSIPDEIERSKEWGRLEDERLTHMMDKMEGELRALSRENTELESLLEAILEREGDLDVKREEVREEEKFLRYDKVALAKKYLPNGEEYY